jgi:hypothetical protein
MSFVAMRQGRWNARTPGGSPRLKDRLKRLREVLRRPLLEFLEERLAPTIAIQFDYSQDTAGFFTQNPQAKTDLQQAAQLLGNPLQNSLAAITPAGGNTWTASFNNPGNPSTFSNVANPNIPANTILVYMGASALANSEHALASADRFTSSGTSDWNTLVALRGQPATGYGPWGGSISFDSNTNWSFAGTGGTPGTNQVDFLSVALHELGHVLGYGTANSWNSQVNSATAPPTFVGPHAEAVHGSGTPIPVPLDGGLANWAEGTTSGGSVVAMDPSIGPGVRRLFTSLDWAGLADIGWSVDQLGVNVPPSVTAGTGFNVSVSALDPTGAVDTTFGGSVTLSLLNNPGGAMFSPQTVAAASGVAAFSGLRLTAAAAGYTFQATSSGLPSATSSALTVTAQPATHLVITAAPPSSVSAGGGFGFTVTAEDQFGDPDPNYNGTVSLSLAANPGNSVLGGVTSNVPFVGGSAVFTNLTLSNPGTGYQIQATANPPTTLTTTSVTTSPFNVKAATATQLVVTGASQLTAGVTAGPPGFGFTVQAEDASGNLDTSFNGTLTAALLTNPGSATLGSTSGTLSATAVGGVATFSGLTLDKAGSGYRLQVTSG